MPDNVDKLFEIMQAKGAASDRGKFRKVFLTPGNKGYKIRKDIYDGLRADGIIDSPTYEDFIRKLRLGGTPTVNKYRQQMFNSVDPNKSRASELTHRAVGQAVRATNNVRKPVTAKVLNRKGKPTGNEFAITPAKTVEDLDREYAQAVSKNWENELHDQMADADKDAAKISDMFKSFIGSTDEVGSVWGNMTRGGGIAGTPHSVTTNNGILENTKARQILAAGDYNRKRRELLQLEQDSRLSKDTSLLGGVKKAYNDIKNGEFSKSVKDLVYGAGFDDHSFFRGMYDAAKDTGFLTSGASDLINAGSLLATKQDLDNGIHTETGDMLMQQAVKNSNAQSQYGDNHGWMYTGGVITTNMAPFMVQIGSAGFSKGMSTSIGKVVQGAASKVALGTMEKATGIAGAHIANYIGKVTGLTTKAFGKAIQYGIVGAAQANTVGLGNVANDVINRYTGQVYQDEQGNYKFGTFDSDGKLVHEGGEDFLTALVKGEAAQTIEFATELAGGGIDAAGTALKNFVTKGGKKIINKYNMENVSKVIDFLLNNKVSKNARYLKAGADRTLGKVEVNSIVGESLEEELGIIANTVFTGDNKISDLWDEKQQSQIWGGMLLSIGLMKGAVAPFHAYNAKQYYSYKHKLDKADVNLSQLLGKEKWEELRNQIDATTNDDIPEMINKINRDVALGKNRQPVREYIQNLLIMRGYDIGNMLAAKKAVEDKGEGVSVKNMEKNQAYQQGRDAYGYDTHEIQLDQEDKQKSLAQLLGISEQQLASMSDEELEGLSGRDDNIDRAIYDYQLSTARYEGVIDNARDQIDLEVQRAAQAVDMYTDKSRNTIRNATIKATGGLEDYGVYIINGNIATHEDGSIDISNSDDMILYYDPTTNTVEHADAMMFAELGSEENADEVRSQAMADAKEKAIKETTGIIDGVVEVGTQFKTVDADGTEHTYEVLADNGDGTAMITIDGNIPTELVKGENVNVPVLFEELQKMKDESDQQRLQAAKAQREQMEKERAEQQMQAQTTQAENPAQEDNIQSAPIEDNLDYSDIIRKDGKVQMVDVSDKDGNNLFPDAKDVFYIQGNKMRTKFAYIDANGELKTQSFPTGLVKIKTRGEVSVDDYKKYRNMILSAESSAMPETSMIEDNSGSIEADRGGIEVEDNEEGKLLNRNDDGAQTEQNQPSASVTTSQEDAAGSSESKDTNISANGNENNESLTFEDGTPIPVDVSGETDLSQTDASHAAEWYDNNLGEDADDWLDGEIKKAKKVLEQAKNMKLTGTKPSELVASKKEKEAAIADAQAHYDSAISIRDSLKERRIAKEENTSDGRRNLIEKARRKFARLKSAVKDDAETVAQIYKETVGTLLHRLYDGTGIDVTDTIPLTAEEYVASNLGAHSLNYEGTETSKGVKQETGLNREDFAKTQLLAADGKGTTIDNLVHSLWENRPSNLDSLDTQDIRNAMLSIITSGFKASEARNYIENLRIAQAENILEEQKKAADNAAFAEENKAESEQQTETAPESEEKTGEENSDEINDEENEKINAPEQNKFPDKLREGSKTIEVPENATEEKPLGEQISKDKVPFEIKGEKSGETYDINDKEDRKRLVAENSVDDKDILDIDMPKHVHKAIKELCKKMGLKVQFLYMGAELNGWIENGTMYLALDANKATQFVFGHEMTHAIKQKNPEAYKELVKVAMAVTTRKEFEEDLAKVYRIYHNASGYNNIDDFVEEVIADNIGKFINDHDLAQRFVLRLNHPVLATILHAIQKIKGLLYGDPYKSADALERIVEKAYVDTAKGEVTNSETGEDVSFSLRQKPEPKKKGIGYKVFVLKDGKLYPPIVANPNGAATPVGVWLDADAAPIAGESKTGRPQVKQGGKGTQGGSGKLAYRPGWHLGVVPYAIQFNRKDAEGNKTLFPKNFVFAEVEYAADVDYQEEARQEGINPSGKYQHSLAGLKHLPTDGYYMYRTNPNPETDPWVITGAMKVNRILTRAEQAELVKNAGREPQQIQEGDIVTDDVVNSINQEIADAPKFSLKVYHGSGADFTEFDFDHMGEGAGSQVFGWGGYVTSSKKIGKDYAAVGQQSAESRHAYSEDTPIEAAVSAILGQDIYNNQAKTFEQKKAQAIKNAENSIVNFSNMLNNSNELDEKSKKFLKESIEKDKKKLEVLRALTEEQYKEEYIKQGRAKNLYEVDIPDDNGRNYLKWYETLSEEQINTIRDALAKKGVDVSSWEKRGFKLDLPFKDVYAAVLPMMMRCEPKEVSKFLSSIGYTGIKYPAGTIMGGAEEDDTNYVIFKPEDMKITEHTKFSLKKDGLTPEIANTPVNIVDADEEHGFKNYAEAREWAKKNIVRTYNDEETGGKGEINISNTAVGKYLSEKAVKKSANKDVHMSVLKVLPSILRESVDAIQHVDRNKVGNERSEDFGVNPDVMIHRCYGAVNIGDKVYGVKITLKENVRTHEKTKLYSYEATKIELLDGQSGDVAMTSPRNSNNSITVAKIIKGFETTKKKGEKFSLKDEKTLAGVHNITEEKLRKALKLGGFANPSLAVIDTSKSGHDNFGEISFIAPSALLDKRTGKTAGTWITDAYTQRYPSVEREMSEKGSQKFRDWVDSLEYPSEAKAEIKRQAEDALSNNNAPAWELMYLKEKGIDIKEYDSRIDYRWKEIISDHPTAEDILSSMQNDPELKEKVTSLAKHAIIHPTWEKVSLEVRRKMYKETGVKASPINPQVRKQTKEIFERDYAPTLLDKDGKPKAEDIKKVVEDIVKEHNDTKKYDFYLSKVKASNYVNKNGLYDDYIRWQENKLDEFGTKNRIFRGYTKDGSRKYVPETLENVSKVMREEADGQTNGSEYTSFGSFIAKLASRVDSTDEMRANKDKLSSNKDKEEFYEKWNGVYYDLAKFLYNDVFYGEQRLHDIVLQSDPKKYAKKEYGITLTPTFMKKLDALKNAVQTGLKSAYFETKYNRPLRLNEFAAAVVPDNLGEDVRKGIENAGLPLYNYDPNKEGDRSRAFNDAVNSSDNIRFSLAGERGAAASDKAEERTARMDNLSVARKMEEEKKDAKAIKMATGWERGADGKWRYEMPDAKIKDTMDVGGGHIVKRYEDDMLWNGGKLSKAIDAPELFKAYPQLKDVRIDTDAIMNDMPSNGEYNSKTNTITIHADELKYMNGILNHEIQHVIQDIEGFAKGGSPRLVRGEVKKRFDEVTKQIRQLRAEGKEDEAKALIEKNRGLYNAYQKNDDYNSYKSLAGEVEARNVSARMNMTPEERRKTLAESTEDVARKDQIFLGVGDVSFSLRDMADGKESGAADMAEDLKSLNTPDEVDDAIKTAIEDMPSGWKMANKKMIHVAQALGENRKAEIAGEEPKFSLKDGTLIKAGTYFSGGGLVEEGLKGIIDPVVAVEYDEKISGVYRNNFGQHIVTADVRDVDPRELVKQIDGEVEYFHASPVCKNYSQAKSNHTEVELDKETAASTAEFINAVKPKVVTIENVKGYKDSDAMKTITDALDANGYTWDADVYNAADYGGYTNRERLIVRAIRDGKLPAKPKKMARKSGWYEAVADIIPTLTEKKNGVANWMDIRLKADGIDWRNIDKPLYVMGSAYADGKIPHAFADELLPTLRTKSGDVIVMPDGKVYRAMGRVLARVSGVSDDYKMPFSENLSHTIIGNGIPTQLTEHVIAPLLTGSDPKFSIRTYHGTGASFDKFDFSHMGEGEGSQAFGWGGYVTNSKEIAEDYTRRAKMRKNNGGFEFVTDLSDSNKDMVRHYIYKYKDVDKGLDAMRKDLSSALEMFPDDDNLKELSDILAKKNEEIAVPDDIAYLYDVDIPDDNGDYLDWENKLKKSHLNKVNKELVRIGKEPIETIYPSRVDGKVRGQDLYDELSSMLGSKEAASTLLSDAGFVGIKYPAGTIFGGAKEDDYNYVIFDENNANIVGNTRFSLRGSTPYDKQMEEWMEKNHLEKGAVPMEKPIMKEGENIFDYANRMVEWTRNQNLWKTAPKQTGFQDALDKWKADNGLSPDAYPPVRPHREYYSSEIGYAEDLEEYNKKKELWKSAPKPKDFDLSVDLDDMNKQLRNIRRAVLNQKNYDQRTVKAVSDLVRKMLNIGWGDGLSRGKVGNLLSAAKNATGANDVKKYLDKAMGILAENYLNRLSTAYDNLINTKGARADQSGVIKMGSLDAKGQAFMSEYKKAINMDDKSLNNYIANIEEDSAKNEDNVEMNDYRLAGIQAAIMYKQQIGGNDADISELKRQIDELKNKKDATKEDKDLLKSLEKKLFENKFDRITMYENLLNNIQRMVKESKGRVKEFREEIAEHKNEILHRANLDLEGVDSTYYDTTTAKKKFVNNDLQRAVFSSTYTFEQFLKFFGKHSANGEGRLYNYFHKLNQDALDEEQLYNEMNRNALDEKTKELFGKNKFMNLVGIDGKNMKEMDVEVTDYSNKETGKRTIHLKQGQMLYIYLVNKETDGEMKLRAMGITEEDVAAIEENLDPRVKAMGEWLQDEYLPECQRRYQATHTKYFGAPMKDVENYFPLAINNRARNVKEDVNQDSDAMSQLAGTSTGAIVTRRVNVIPLDIENADAFEVAFNHLQEMEEWSAMLPFRQDINTLLSYTHFRNQVQNMSSVAYGSGKTLWDEFKQTAQIAAGTYKPKVNAGMMDSRIAAAMGGIAVAKISGRLWTAIKQSQSATVFLPECDFTRFVKNGVNPYGSWKWAKENIPDFRKRIENITYGDVKLRQYLDELEKYHDWTKVISKWGMAPNILVDGITCAVGARSVYETEVNRLTKLGYPKEKAEEKAYYKAVAAYNKTQQSSGGMYLSPMQVDRTYVSAALSLFKNANYAYGRMQIEACRGLARTYDLWGGKHKTTLIESMTRQIMEEDGLDENTARAIAKATYNRTFRQSIGRLINFATLVPISWALYKVLPYLLTGDDDDKKKDMIEEAVLKGFATSLSDNYVIPFASNILNAGLKVEDGKPTFDPEVFRYQNLYINPATSDLANIYSMIGNQKWYSVANKLGMLGVQSLIGFNPETVGALYQAFAEADYDNNNTAKEWQIGILKAISAPEESIRELYMDELGLKSGDKDAMKKFMSLAGLDADDINKVPLAELEKRYAERQINRDNLLSQIVMDAETFNGYVNKYQKSFEKKIKDKMDKWDEYDKKKADEFFDTTSDPKLKDMIEKKRAKDANAAADEQIAKEGLNQEKKGKEPSEEAYDAVKMSIDVAEDNAISTYNKVLNKRYAALNDEYNNQTDAMKYIFMSKHPNFKAYKDLESEYTTYGKKMKELKEKLVSADGYDAKQTILKQIRAEREKFSELQSKVR